ncbi:dynein regulatory complex protein 11 isoform X1 [Lucilia sericata]|uniref:dynein regulatory complex protein 11 isoform X1 n=1 Tax=Lucilia sericata TaxID=13632 RepID=UPI0018A86438|nr:dynein regulatory complex protein 11 isoform X1 [Lucilia sericata]
MSFEFNYKFWVATKKDLKHLIRRQNVLKKKEPIEDPIITFQMLSQIYILYVELVQKLGYLYTETVQVQKKNIIQNLIEPATQRLLELKYSLKNIELSEYVYLDKSLIERKLTPYDLLIWRSPNFMYRRPIEIRSALNKGEQFHLPKEIKNCNSKADKVDAIIKLQSHERSRQARIYKCAVEHNKNNMKINIDKNIAYSFNHKNDQSFLIPVKRTIFSTNFMNSAVKCHKLLDTENLEEYQNVGDYYISEQLERSASKIQMAWKNYKAKKIFKMKQNIKQSLYGMRKGKKLNNPEEREYNAFKIYQKEFQQNVLDKKYVQLITDERTRLLQEYKPQIMEDISDHIREWFKEFYEKTSDFHPYPDALKSGTILALIDETMTLEEFKEYQKEQSFSKEEKKNLREKLKLQKQKEKEKIKKEKLKEMKRQKKMRDAGIYDIGQEFQTNKNIEKIESTLSQFSIDWKNVDEYLNKKHDVIKEWITENELAIIHKELRGLVDEYMRIEYELLKKAWCSDNKKKYKSSMAKKVKNIKETKIKTSNDLTADRTIESLYEELKKLEIIENYPKKYFDSFLGDFNLMADDTRNDNHIVTLDPAKADIKMVIQDNMFGMGALNVDKPKTLCLIGSDNNGKQLLCNIIASEIGAIFINLSPEKTYHFSENLKYFVHVVMKVAKAFQPTIIYIKDVHRIFWKKIPKDQIYMKPTLLKVALVKDVLKSIRKEDKIMVVGTSNLPWSANASFKKVFQNMLLIPESDYGSIFLMWLELITQNVASDYFEDCMLSVLAKLFQKYSSGDITDSVENILKIERRMRLHTNRLNPNEFLEYFISRPYPLFPLEEKVSEKYKNWYSKSSKFGNLKLSQGMKKITKK